MTSRDIFIICDGGLGPEGATFVEIEDEYGYSIRVGEWFQRNDGYWVLKITEKDLKVPDQEG